METQVIIFILLFGGVQSLLLSSFLLRNKLPWGSGTFLVLYLSVMTLQITLKVMSKIWLMGNWPVLYNISSYLPLLYGPLIFLFVKHLFTSRTSNTAAGLHFIPMALAIVFMTLDQYKSVPESIARIFFHPVFRLAVTMTSIVVYHVLSFRLWKQQELRTEYLNAGWVKRFIFLSLAVTLVVVISIFLLYLNYPNGHQYRYGFIALSLFIYWISYSALTVSPEFAVVNERAVNGPSIVESPPLLTVYRQPSKYLNSTLKDEEAQSICTRLFELMRSAKPYLNPDITINQLADTLQCTRHHLSQVLNDKMHQSYNDYINSLRMEEARRMLQEPQYLQYKIASIAYESGFNSLSTFNEVFKKYMGKTPSEFRKEMLKETLKQRV